MNDRSESEPASAGGGDDFDQPDSPAHQVGPGRNAGGAPPTDEDFRDRDRIDTNSPKPGSGRRWLVIAKGIIAMLVAVGLYFATRAATEQWQQQRDQSLARIEQLEMAIEATSDRERRAELLQRRTRLQSSLPELANLRWSWIAAAALLYGLSLIPPGILLHRGLQTLGQPIRPAIAVAAQLLGHVGKYVPGKAVVVVVRTGVLNQHGVSLVAATLSVFMETFLMMAVGGVVAGVVILWLPVPNWLIASAIAVAIVASLPTLPPVLSRVAKRLSPARQALPPRVTWQLFVAGWVCSLSSWLLIGGSFTAITYAVPSPTDLPPLAIGYAVSTAAISLAMVIGFASLLPGGAGVRELVLTTVLSVSLGAAHGLIAAIAARLLFIMVEAVMALAAWIWLRRAAPQPG